MTKHELSRRKILDIEGAQTFLEVKDTATFDVFGQFVIHVADTSCPGLIDWLDAGGKAGAEGLVWSKSYAYGVGECWSGEKRYPRSNLLVNWNGGCTRQADARWRRLDDVLTAIASGR